MATQCNRIKGLWISLTWTILLPFPARAELTPEAPQFFTQTIQPILAEHCHQCHSHQSETIQGGLVVDSRAGLLAGGDRGPAIVPGHPAKSLLLQAVQHHRDDLKMPPPKSEVPQLSAAQIDALKTWIQTGAPWPGSTALPKTSPDADQFTAEDRAWWAFQPVASPDIPQPRQMDWVENSIDAFVLARLERQGLQPAPEADRATLIRRAYFDLWGLPPSPDEIAAFVHDPSPDAYRQLIDRLLDSPHYGERWAQHWLDLVRFAESDGYKADAFRPEAWRYRNYVIQSLNEDKPYNRFIMEQLAGDELAPNNPEALVATGYLRHGIYEYNQRDVKRQWDHMLYDITDTTAEVFLGLGLACARCHDHKFDPILQKDYFRFLAFFNALLPREDVPLVTAQEWTRHQTQLAAWEDATSNIRQEMDSIRQRYLQNAAHRAIIKFPEDIQAAMNKPLATRTPYETQIAALAYRQVVYEQDNIHTKLSKEDKQRLEELQNELQSFADLKPNDLPHGLVATDVGPEASPTTIPKNPDAATIAPGVPSIFNPKPARISPVPSAPNSTGRRAALAQWIARDDNPLTSRVMANRIWQKHFGRGLVTTPSDLGRLGEMPTYPGLLDWLAKEFVAHNWSLKHLHRLIMNSAVYRQASDVDAPPVARRIDPDNHYLWRMNLRRLDGEQIRDALLAATGELNREQIQGSRDFNDPVRTVYTKRKRNSRPELLEAFDPPDTYASTPERNTTTSPTQSLLMLNSDYTLKRAEKLAQHLAASGLADDQARVQHAYLRTLGRAPDNQEIHAALKFLDQVADHTDADPAKSPPTDSRLTAWTDFCHALFNSSEFLYVD